MPLSVEHAALLLLFQNRPKLALELLHAAGLETDVGEPGSLESVDLTAAVPAEYRTDLVVRYHGGERPLVVVVEGQRAEDPDKRYSWPVYVALLRARFRCEVRLVVVAPRRRVARWCARPIDIGNGAIFTPTVFGPDLIPVVTDAEQARAAPELAVLSAMAHGRDELTQAVAIGLASLSAAEGLDRERGVIYFDLVRAALGEAARKAVDAMISQDYKFHSDIALKARAEGEARGEANAVIAVLEARGIALTAVERERISTCTDLKVLDGWVRRAVTAASAAELFE